MSQVFSWRDSDHSGGEVCVGCPACEGVLTLHQPDADLPDRLLATCEECKSWYLSNQDGSVLIPIDEAHGLW